MDKKEMINWLYALCGACEDMELVRANFKDHRKPLHMTAHKLIHEVVGALEDQPVGKWRIDIDKSRDLFDWQRFYCPACGSWQTYGETNYCPNCGKRVETKYDREAQS